MSCFQSVFPRPMRFGCTFLIAIILFHQHPSRAQYSAAFDSSLRAAMAGNDPATRLEKLRVLSMQSEAGSVFQMIDYGKKFLETATEVQSDTDKSVAHIMLAAGYERNRDFRQAIDHSLQAIRIADERGDFLTEIRAFEGLAFTYGTMGLMSGDKTDMDKAFDYGNRALQMSKKHSISKEEPYALTTLADVCAMNAKYDSAIRLYRLSISSREQQHAPALLSTYTNLAIALNLNKNYAAALAVYNTADSISDIQNAGAGAVYKQKIASNKAILLSDMGKWRESEALTQTVLADAQQTGAMDIQVDMVDHLKNLYQKQGRYPEALALSDTLAAIKERMLSAERTGQVAEMEARYDAGVKDQQIVGQQHTIQQNRRLNLGLMGGITLLLGLGTAAVIGLRRSRRLNRKITIQQQQLIEQKTELQRINKTKDQLFSLIGHDVRVPLNSMMAYATLLDEQGSLPSEKIRKYNADLRQTLGNTTVLMENLLQFAKTQMQSIKPFPEHISLHAVVDGAVRLLQPALDMKKLQLMNHIPASTKVYADEDMAGVIFRNLLSNAIKYSHPGGTITITVQQPDGAHLSCTLQDEGPGIMPELVAQLNAPLLTAPLPSTMGTSHEKGSGLGLMLSKTFARIMGGDMLVSSELGHGAAFSVILPTEKN